MNYKITHDKCGKEITLNTHEAIGYMDENKTIHAVWDCPECGKEIDGIQMQHYIRGLKRAKDLKQPASKAEAPPAKSADIIPERKSFKRYFFHNQTMTILDYPLSVTNHGDVYHDSSEGFRKLDSFWQPKIGCLNVVLPNENTIQLSPSKEGLILREAKK